MICMSPFSVFWLFLSPRSPPLGCRTARNLCLPPLCPFLPAMHMGGSAHNCIYCKPFALPRSVCPFTLLTERVIVRHIFVRFMRSR